jgi:endonuclease YncB( thermonuclease family)
VKRRAAAALLCAALLGGCELGARPGGGSSAESRSAEVVRPVDGDTLDVLLEGREETVRLVGIDTPEVYEGTECGGPAASGAMKELVQRGDRVRLIGDPSQDDRDRYGRLLRYVEKDGRDLGEAQVRAGHAEVYVFEEPFERVEPYRSASRRASALGAGVWRACGGDFHSSR